MAELRMKLRSGRRFYLSGCLATLGLWVMAHAARADDSGALLDRWIAAQTNVQTWSADLVQTRALKVLTQPLVSTGKVWVATPGRFRWELGQPPQTIALRQSNQLCIIYPRLKRAEKYSLGGAQTGPWKDALALLDASFPRSRADLEARFRVLSAVLTDATVLVTLQPKSEFARQFMTELRVTVRADDFTPAATELKFSDGSSMRTEFRNAVLNGPTDAELFEARLEADFKVEEVSSR